MSTSDMTDSPTIQVAIKGTDKSIGNPSATLCFMFSTLSILFWANMLGLLGPDAQIVLGFIQLGCFAAYHICSRGLLQRGESFDGNVFMVFAAMFTGCGGLLNTIAPVCHLLGVPFSDTAPGVIWLICGIILLLICPGVRKGPALGFLFYIFGGAGLLVMGLLTLRLVPTAGFTEFAAWMFFIAGMMGFYIFVATMLGFSGIAISTGKPLFSDKKAHRIHTPSARSVNPAVAHDSAE